MRIYVASSWRNNVQPEVVKTLRDAGHQVYDFKNPDTRSGFQWSAIDPKWQNWTFEQYEQALNHPTAEAGFKSDFDAMKWADACVLVLPCGRSAHLEAGWMKGSGKLTLIYTPTMEEPELMYKICDGIYDNLEDILTRLSARDAGTTYICGPITGHDETLVRKQFSDAAEELRRRGLVPVSPLNNGLPWNAPWEDHVKASLLMMLRCDGLYVLEGWEDSRGCKLEVKLARDLAMNVTLAGENKEEPSWE